VTQQKFNTSLYSDDIQTPTFQQPCYVKNTNNYIDILQAMIVELKKLSVKIDPNNMRVIIMGGIDSNEKTIVFEKGK
jgi:hypothetical protein